MQAFADLIAVDDQRAERGKHQERQESVEQRGARHHEADPVGNDQQPRDRADERRAADPPHDPHHQRHHDDSEHRAGEPPAQPGVAEQRLADRDQLLAHRRMHDQAVTGVVLDPVVVQHLPGLWRVMLLVEDRGAGVGGRAQVHRPGQRRQRGDDAGHHPAL